MIYLLLIAAAAALGATLFLGRRRGQTRHQELEQEGKCSACGGSGKCPQPGCELGTLQAPWVKRRLLTRERSTLPIGDVCPRCQGSGVCKVCGGTGNRFGAVPTISREEAERAALRGDAEALYWAVLSVGARESDLGWAEDYCLALAAHRSHQIRGAAMLAIGELARRHRAFDGERITPAVASGLADPHRQVRHHAETTAAAIERLHGVRIEPAQERAGNDD